MERWLPWFYAFVACSATLGLLWLAIRVKFVAHWKRVLARVFGIALSVPFALASIFLLMAGGCEHSTPLIGSPDGNHVARIMVTAGSSAVDQDYASVIVRRSWSPVWTNAYFGLGYFGHGGQVEPRVKWLDNSHLLIDRPDDDWYLPPCKSTREVIVVCESHKVNSWN